MAAALMMLAIHKDFQQKAYDEVKRFFEESSEEITLKNVSNLPYVEMVLKETMRLFPAASIVGRVSTGQVEMGKEGLNFIMHLLLDKQQFSRFSCDPA